jgi:hypothetical protein
VPVIEIVSYFVTCDECDWSDGEFSDEEFAAEQLDIHVKEKHPSDPVGSV